MSVALVRDDKIVEDVRLLDEDDNSYYGEHRVFGGRWFERDRHAWHAADDRGMRRRFAEGWESIGRPFFRCVYCEDYHLRPKEPGTPCCSRERFVRNLIFSFPMLRRQAPGLTPWEPMKWARWWRTSGAQTSGSYHAVAFVLSVWSGGGKEWKKRGYEFDLVRALQALDDAHRRALQAWVTHPWWP